MRCITLLGLSIFLTQALAENLEAKNSEENQSDNAQGSVDNLASTLVDKLIGRVGQMPAHDGDLDETTLAKAPGSTIGKTAPMSLPQPVMSRVVTPALRAIPAMRSHTQPISAVGGMASRVHAVNPLKNGATRDVSAAATATEDKFKVPLYDLDKKPVGDISLDNSVFGLEPSPHILKVISQWQRAARRQGSASTRTRSQMRGSGKKQAPQKGRGSARIGTKRAYGRIGGGKAWGPKPRDWSYDMNKKMRHLGLRHVLSSKLHEGKLSILSDVEAKTPKTLVALKQLQNFEPELDKMKSNEGKHGLGRTRPKTMVILDGPVPDPGFAKSVQNIAGVNLIPHTAAIVYDILNADNLLITKQGVEGLEARLGAFDSVVKPLRNKDIKNYHAKHTAKDADVEYKIYQKKPTGYIR